MLECERKTYFVEDECENRMWCDPQEMSRGTCDQTMSVIFLGSGKEKKRKKKKKKKEKEKEKEIPLYHPAIPSALNVFQRQSNGFV